MDNQTAISYFYSKMEQGLIENDTQQEVYEQAISALMLVDALEQPHRPKKETSIAANEKQIRSQR